MSVGLPGMDMISTLVLALGAALPGGEGHAALHPADAELFLELPDAPGLVAAYGAAPMVQTFRDPAVARFFAGLPVDPVRALTSIGTLLVPGRDLTPLFAGLTAVSLSASLGANPAQPELLAFQTVLDLASPELALEVQRGLHGLAAVETSAVGPTRFSLAPLRGITCWSLLEASRLVVGGGRTSPEAYEACRRGAGPAWTSSSLAGWGRERLSHGEGAVVLRAQQTRSPLETLSILVALASGESSALRIPAELDPFRGPSVLEMRLAGERFVTEIFTPDAAGGSTTGARLLDAAWLATVPGDVLAFYSSAFDTPGISAQARRLLAATDAGGTAAEVEVKLGFPLERLLGHLGPGMLAYVLPRSGIGLPPSYVWIEVREPAAFQADLETFCAKLPELLPGASAETRDYRPKNAATGERERIPVTAIALPPGTLELGPMLSLSPSLALVGDRLLVGTAPMSVKRELKRLFEEPSGAAAPPRALDLPSGALSLLWVDWGRLVQSVLELVRGLGSLLGGLDELPFDPKALPEARLLTRAMLPTVHTSRRVEGGVLRRHEASFGPETWLALAAAGYGLWTGQAAAAPFAPSSAGASEAPAPVADEAAEKTATRLADLRTGLAVFHLALGSYPESLAELVAPTTDFPRGFLEDQSVPSDGWGRAFHYARADEGGYELRSLGADGVDQSGGGDDVALDGPR